MRKHPDVRGIVPIVLLFMPVLAGGCTTVEFPRQPTSVEETGGVLRLSYDLDGEGSIDYVETTDASGRIVRLERFADRDNRALWSVNIDEVKRSECRHLIIIIDGLPYEVTRRYQERGGLRFFGRPQRMIAPFPSMTDLALAEVFQSRRPISYEASYYDRERRRLSSILDVYFGNENAEWNRHVDHRLSFIMDGVMYVYPRWVYRKEIRDLQSNFRKSAKNTFVAYLSSTSGLGTDEGEPGYYYILDYIDRLTHQLMLEHKGKVQVTLLSDHGHTLVPAEHADLEGTLKRAGYRPAKQLCGPRDFVSARFGLVTYSAIWTDEPAELAAAALDSYAVVQTFYAEGDDVVVRDRSGLARVQRKDGSYRYEIESGDPLKLKPVIETLRGEGKTDAEGYVDDRVLFAATATHEYPDALHRVWQAFHGLTEKPPDVILTLRDDRWEGRESLAGWTHLRSTHGSLNRANSTAVVISTAGDVPGPIRTSGFRDALKRMYPERDLSNPDDTLSCTQRTDGGNERPAK